MNESGEGPSSLPKEWQDFLNDGNTIAKPDHTNNNKQQLSVRSLELIYTKTDWPPG